MGFAFPGRTLPLARDTFRALRHRNFRLLWLGQLISLVGGWMQNVARGWLVLRLTDSPFQLGLVGFFTFLPILLFALPAGVLADRGSRRKMLVWVQILGMSQSALLAILTQTGRIEVWHIAAIAFGMGTIGAVDIPVRQSLLQDLVGREDLPNAIALNSLAFNFARLIGPAIAGLLLATMSEAAIFWINAASFSAVLIGLLRMRLSEPAASRKHGNWTQEIAQGIRYAAGEPRTRAVLSLVLVTSIFAFPYSVLLPVFARDILSIGAAGLGYLTSATGVGAMGGALFVAVRKRAAHPGRTIAGALLILGAALIGFSYSTRFEFSLALLFCVGFAMIVQMATSNTVLQMLAPPTMRGRIVSLYMLCFLGMSPIGSLFSGWVAASWGAPRAVALGGVACVLVSGWFLTRIPALRAAVARHQEEEGY